MDPARSGAALILALILLAALLLLGLPFLFSQASSLSGTRSFSAQRLAVIGQANARNVATAVAAYLLTPSATAQPLGATSGWIQWSSLNSGAGSASGLGLPGSHVSLMGSPEAGDGSLAITLPALPGSAGTVSGSTYLGAVVTDEAGRLDPNHLSEATWSRLLTVVGIQDWPDASVYPALTQASPPGSYAPNSSPLGQLAKALASLRPHLPLGRITTLEQLLLANPQMPANQPPGPWTKLRTPLSRAELERLRPYLTLHNPAPGRQGLIDLGTVVQQDLNPLSGLYTAWTDSALDPFQALVGHGSVIIGEATPGSGVHPVGIANDPDATQTSSQLVLSGGMLAVDTSASAQLISTPGSSLLLEVPGSVNIHQLGPVVRSALVRAQDLPLAIPMEGSRLGVIATVAGLWNFQGHTQAGEPLAPWDAAPWIDPLSTGDELPPLGIRSEGVMQISSAATVTDVLGRQIAQAQERADIQALPQEYLQERRWLTQGDFHAAVLQRWASQMQAWPVAVERLSDAIPDDHDFGAGGEHLADIPATTGVRARPLASEASMYAPGDASTPPQVRAAIPYLQWPLEHEAIDWRVAFGGGAPVTSAHVCDAEACRAAAFVRSPAQVLLPASALGAMRPDGYHHAAGSRLAYGLAANGPLADGVPLTSAMLLPRDSTQELGARQIGLWIEPTADWEVGSGVHPIWEARMPAANVGTLLDGSPGSTDCENYLGLLYDADHSLLVLAMAPPCQETTGDWGPLITPLSLTDQLLDHQCLGDAPTVPLAPDPYADGGVGLRAFSGTFARNRVLHCTFTPPQHGQPYFRAGQWYHLQVALACDRPDGVALIVDGMVGRDASHIPAGPTLTAFGDHCTLPGVMLRQDLPYLPAQSQQDLLLPAITVSAPAPLTARSLLPSHGIVRCDDEYIAYQAISPDGTQLLDCIRGRRQETNASSPNPFQAFPTLQAHAAGSWMVPGGYHLTWGGAASGGVLYRGGCTLAQALPIGDLGYAASPGAVWLPPASAGTLTEGGSIPIMAAASTWSAFPASGIISLHGTYLVYAAKGPASLLGVTSLAAPGWSMAPAACLSATPIPPTGLPYLASDPIVVVSMQVQGLDPLTPGAYKQATSGNGDQFLVSLQDSLAPAQVEWLAYDGIVSDHAAHGYVVSRSGFGIASRAQDRTALGTHHQPLTTLVVPVQTELGNAGHYLATGDVLTLSPHAQVAGSPSAEPSASTVVVRYAATDGFRVAPGDQVADTHNWYCSFAQAIPAASQDVVPGLALGLARWDLICAPGWTGSDLTAAINPLLGFQQSLQPRGALPRCDGWSTGWAVPGSDAVVWIASTDPNAPTPLSSDCAVDDLTAGGLTHAGPGFDGHESQGSPVDAVMHGVEWWWRAGVPGLQLDASDPLSDVVVQMTTPLFAAGSAQMGLVLIDGEVFAYQRPTSAEASAISTASQGLQLAYPNLPLITPAMVLGNGSFARLVARGLLSDGAGGSDHRAGPLLVTSGPSLSDGMPHFPHLGAIRLPLGPVRQLDGVVSASGSNPWFALHDLPDDPNGPTPSARPLGAPQALVCSPDGTQSELMQLIGPKSSDGAQDGQAGDWCTAPWLRGRSNTGLVTAGGGADWNGAPGSPRPIVIGWWPRYPSAMPFQDHSAPVERSRSFPWMSFPFGVAGGYVDASRFALLPAAYSGLPLASVAVSRDPEFVVEARALAYAQHWTGPTPCMDWSQQAPCVLPHPGADPTDASTAFLPEHDGSHSFSDGSDVQPVDGVDLRISYRYANPPSSRLEDMAAAGNRAPTISGVSVRCLAPVRILQVEGGR